MKHLEKALLGVGITLVLQAFSLIPAFFVMLALGAAHDQWPVIPALGFWTTYLLTMGINALLRLIPASRIRSSDVDD